MALGLSVGYETRFPVGWLHCFWIGWAKYMVPILSSNGLLAQVISGNFPPFYRGHWQSPCTALMAGKCLPLGLCKETVKESAGNVMRGRRRVNSQGTWALRGLKSLLTQLFVQQLVYIIINELSNFCITGPLWTGFPLTKSQYCRKVLLWYHWRLHRIHAVCVWLCSGV